MIVRSHKSRVCMQQIIFCQILALILLLLFQKSKKKYFKPLTDEWLVAFLNLSIFTEIHFSTIRLSTLFVKGYTINKVIESCLILKLLQILRQRWWSNISIPFALIVRKNERPLSRNKLQNFLIRTPRKIKYKTYCCFTSYLSYISINII